MQYRVHITYDGDLEQDDGVVGDRLLEELLKQCDAWGPVLTGHVPERRFTVTVAVDADGVETALALAAPTIGTALTLAGMSRPARAAEVELVRDDAPAAAA